MKEIQKPLNNHIMKNKVLITLAALLGVFLMLDTSLLAQTTESSSSRESSRSREASRATGSTRIVTVPDIEIAEMMDHDYSFAYTTGSGSGEKNSKLSLSKRYSGQSANKRGSFNIEEGVTKIRLSISGSVVVGSITLELYKPGNKALKKLTIDDSADISWSQSINVKEGDKQYYGEWAYVIDAKNVEGRYKISINTY
jgi:hypothetical protein